MKLKIKFIVAFLVIAVVSACGVINKKNKGKGFNVFSLSQDKQLGFQTASEIDGNPGQYPLLDSVKYAKVYQYLYKVRDNILNTGEVSLKDEFSWRLRIVHDDNTLNAFCTPGGYIYFYTGILKFLESEDELAGVMAHEVAHADMRHSTRQMSTMYSIQVIEQVLLGDPTLLSQLTKSIVGLKFSRKHETQADEMSVKYLCPTIYNAAGGAGFFQKIEAMSEGGRQPEFLSTHPNPANRIENFINNKTTMGCAGTNDFKVEYQKMVAMLPK